MTKALLITAALLVGNLVGTTCYAAFPVSQFAGHGHWKDDRGNEGSYNVSATSSADGIASVYQYDAKDGGRQVETQLTVAPTQNGFFNVTSSNQVIGSGYCMTVQCHYAVTQALGNARDLEETVVFIDNHLYRVGSKMVDGHRIGWEESLLVQASTTPPLQH